jgi:hypothetical protein
MAVSMISDISARRSGSYPRQELTTKEFFFSSSAVLIVDIV